MTLGGASISLPTGASDPNQGSFLWGVPPFPATIACGAKDIVPSGYNKIGPAITFGPVTQTFQREVPLSVPINPGMIPSTARLRHVRLAYSGPSFLAPRTVPVADVRLEQVNGAWALTFKAPRLGTYQAVVPPSGGTTTFQRSMTYRAVMGISMGGGGAASFGFRHHDLFDVVAPLGGPVDWTWMLDYISNNHLGGFRPIPSGTTLADIQLNETLCSTNADCKSDETCVGRAHEPRHAGQVPADASRPRALRAPADVQHLVVRVPEGRQRRQLRIAAPTRRSSAISRSCSATPNGENLTPGAQNLPPGVLPTDPSVVGDHPGSECGTWVDPVCPVTPAPMPWPNGAVATSCQVDADCGDAGETCTNGVCGPACDLTKEQEIANDCPAERCMHPLTLLNYFDADYNPDGTFPVITVCDGSPQNQALTPYSNTWGPTGNTQPLEVGLAVDYNGNGMRDELEPIIRGGHERWDDFGTDGIPSSMEPGYMPGVNDDPSGDDYNAQYNPSGTENDHRYQEGEKFYDYGLDGVPNTPQQPPGRLGEAGRRLRRRRGRRRLHGVERPPALLGSRRARPSSGRWSTPRWCPARARRRRPLARRRVDRRRPARSLQLRRGRAAPRGRALHPRARLDLPDRRDAGAGPRSDERRLLRPEAHRLQRPAPAWSSSGTARSIPRRPTSTTAAASTSARPASSRARLQSALYFIGARWRNHPELTIQADDSPSNAAPNAPLCEVLGTCTISFTSSGGRTGPVGISLPPGYANKGLQSIRYPRHLPAARLRAGADGPRGRDRAAEELDEQLAQQRREAGCPRRSSCTWTAAAARTRTGPRSASRARSSATARCRTAPRTRPGGSSS